MEYMAVLCLAVLSCVTFVCSILNVDSDWQRTTLQSVFAQNRYHDGGGGKAEARAFIKEHFNKIGLTVVTQTFNTDREDVKGENIIGIMKGSTYGTPSGYFYAIGSHYDTTPKTPGVNDNGSGMVAMLEAARILAESGQHRNTIVFVAFDFEEWNSDSGTACSKLGCGSRSLLKEWPPAEIGDALPQSVFRGIIVMDSVMNYDKNDNSQQLPKDFDRKFNHAFKEIQSDGFQGDFLAAAGRQLDNNLMDKFTDSWSELDDSELEIVRISVPMPNSGDIAINFGDFLRSDHVAFWRAGLQAIFLSDSALFRGYMKNCYHKACDNVGNIDDDNVKFLGKVTNALVRTMNKLSLIDNIPPMRNGQTPSAGKNLQSSAGKNLPSSDRKNPKLPMGQVFHSSERNSCPALVMSVPTTFTCGMVMLLYKINTFG